MENRLSRQATDDREVDGVLESGAEVLRDAIKPPSSRSEVDNTLEKWFNKKRTLPESPQVNENMK